MLTDVLRAISLLAANNGLSHELPQLEATVRINVDHTLAQIAIN